MIGFVTSVKHPDQAKSWSRVGRLLETTLSSVCRQTDPDFVVVVVANRPPPSTFQDARVQFVEVDFPAPPSDGSAGARYRAHLIDKGTKRAIGTAVARRQGASYVMYFDADDYMHRELARWAHDRVGHPGWYSPLGLIHTQGFRTVHAVESDFHMRNGSTTMVRSDLTEVPADLSDVATQQEVIDMLGRESIEDFLGGHGQWDRRADALGVGPLDPWPFPAAIWVIGNGENVSANLVSGRTAQLIDRSIEADFGLAPPSRWHDATRRVTTGGRRVLRTISHRGRWVR